MVVVLILGSALIGAACGSGAGPMEDPIALAGRLAGATADEKVSILRRLAALGPRAEQAMPAVVAAIEAVEEHLDDAVQRAAIDALVAVGPAAHAALVEALDDGGGEANDHLWQVLASLRPPPIDLLERRAVQVPANWGWCPFARVLGRIGRDAVPALERLVAGGEGVVSDDAFGALIEMEARDVFLRWVESSDEALVRRGWGGLAAVGVRSTDDLARLERLRPKEPLDSGIVRASGSVGSEYALRAASSDVPAQREGAARSLVAFVTTTPAALDALVRLCSDPDASVATTAMSAIVHFEGSAAAFLPALARAVDDPARRETALRTIVGLGPVALPAADAVRAWVHSAEPGDGALGLVALGSIGRPKDLPEVVRLLRSDPEAQTREAAALALAAYGTSARTELDMIVAALSDPELSVREAAVKALAYVFGGDSVANVRYLPHPSHVNGTIDFDGRTRGNRTEPRSLPRDVAAACRPAFARMLRTVEPPWERQMAANWLASFGPPGTAVLREHLSMTEANARLWRGLQKWISVTDPELSREVRERFGEQKR